MVQFFTEISLFLALTFFKLDKKTKNVPGTFVSACSYFIMRNWMAPKVFRSNRRIRQNKLSACVENMMFHSCLVYMNANAFYRTWRIRGCKVVCFT
jgi:hypothetical protein